MFKKVKKNIVIVGGGTAGWLTALYAKKKFSNYEIILIESKSIGILGAGEGSTPSLINFLDYINIPVSRLIKDADATIKNGIKFTNWNNDKSFYYHGFLNEKEIGPSYFYSRDILPKTNLLYVYSNAHNKKLGNTDFVEKIGEKNKVGFTPIFDNFINNVEDPILRYRSSSHFSIHFNASKMANTLRKIGEERGIKVIEDEVDDIKQDKNKNISKLILKNNKPIKTNFVFDCTGFSRLIIGKLYNSEWKSHKETLPVDSAVPFFLSMEESIPSYTEAIAMKYGWMWKIPLQSRYGCGYVYDSSLISEEDAIKEIENYLGFEPEYPRKNKGGFKFDAGYYKTPWVNNCIAVGLSSGFIEPLEATSIWVSIINISNAMSNINNIENVRQEIVDEFNQEFVKVNDEVVDFLHLHYLTKRNDTDFWNNFNTKIKYSNYLKKIIDSQDYKVWEYRDFLGNIFPLESWMSVRQGLGLINNKIYKENCVSNNVDEFIEKRYNQFIINQDKFVENCVDHRKFIEDMKI